MSRRLRSPHAAQLDARYPEQVRARWLPRLLAADVSPRSHQFPECVWLCGYEFDSILRDLGQSLRKLLRSAAVRMHKLLREIMEDVDPTDNDIRCLLKNCPELAPHFSAYT